MPRVGTAVSRPVQFLSILVLISLVYFLTIGSSLRSYQQQQGNLLSSKKLTNKDDNPHHHHTQNEHVLRQELDQHRHEDKHVHNHQLESEHHHPLQQQQQQHSGDSSNNDKDFPPLIRPTTPSNDNGDEGRSKGKKVHNAYLVIISNEDFVDGALTLGVSLRLHSPFLQSGEAHLVSIVTDKRLCDRSIARLREQGTYDTVVEVPSLAVRAPGAFWKDTFDKVYMFNLTEYKRVVFMDADMLCVRPPDSLFSIKGISHDWLAAIGNRGKGGGETYFQTGMMVIEPSRKVFMKIMREFESGVPPKGRQYNQGMHGRDGVLLRNVFKANFRPLDNKYSRNLNPRFPIPKSVVSLHFRGKHKPWFDKRSAVEDPELGKKEFGFGYSLWWDIYEHYVHSNNNNKHSDEFGGTAADAGISPATHVWMMRYSKKEYVQLLSAEDKRRRDVAFESEEYGGQFVKGKRGQSCTEACHEMPHIPANDDENKSSNDNNKEMKTMECVEAAFNFTSAEDCKTLERVLGPCKVCQMGVYWRQHMGNDYPSIDAKTKVCTFNLLLDQRGLPNCAARHNTSQRLCPCKSQKKEKVV